MDGLIRDTNNVRAGYFTSKIDRQINRFFNIDKKIYI